MGFFFGRLFVVVEAPHQFRINVEAFETSSISVSGVHDKVRWGHMVEIRFVSVCGVCVSGVSFLTLAGWFKLQKKWENNQSDVVL